MHYTYIIQSVGDKSYYSGSTQNLKARLLKHNSKSVTYTSSKAPFRMIWYAAFMTKAKAIAFEKYLKSSSGFAFRNKRLI